MTRTMFTSLVFLSSALLVAGKTQKLCGIFQNLTSSSGRYNMGTNQWGDDGSGGQCVFYDPKATPETNATAFTATWQWEENIDSVHSYPNVYLESKEFPVQINNTKSFNVDVTWTMGTGNDVATTIEESELMSTGVKANVAFDMFLDTNKTISNNASLAQYEFMVWMAAFGGAQPLGYTTTTNLINYTLGDTDFTLYQGQNTQGQTVLSWYPADDTDLATFSGDIAVLLHQLVDNSLVPESAYMGSAQFGTETTHSTGNVTFRASTIMMDLEVYEATTSAAVRATASSTLLLMSFGYALYWLWV